LHGRLAVAGRLAARLTLILTRADRLAAAMWLSWRLPLAGRLALLGRPRPARAWWLGLAVRLRLAT
jgi:hypothetical protein